MSAASAASPMALMEILKSTFVDQLDAIKQDTVDQLDAIKQNTVARLDRFKSTTEKQFDVAAVMIAQQADTVTNAQLLACMTQQNAQLKEQGAQLKEQGAQLREQGAQLKYLGENVKTQVLGLRRSKESTPSILYVPIKASKQSLALSTIQSVDTPPIEPTTSPLAFSPITSVGAPLAHPTASPLTLSDPQAIDITPVKAVSSPPPSLSQVAPLDKPATPPKVSVEPIEERAGPVQDSALEEWQIEPISPCLNGITIIDGNNSCIEVYQGSVYLSLLGDPMAIIQAALTSDDVTELLQQEVFYQKVLPVDYGYQCSIVGKARGRGFREAISKISRLLLSLLSMTPAKDRSVERCPAFRAMKVLIRLSCVIERECAMFSFSSVASGSDVIYTLRVKSIINFLETIKKTANMDILHLLMASMASVTRPPTTTSGPLIIASLASKPIFRPVASNILEDHVVEEDAASTKPSSGSKTFLFTPSSSFSDKSEHTKKLGTVPQPEPAEQIEIKEQDHTVASKLPEAPTPQPVPSPSKPAECSAPTPSQISPDAPTETIPPNGSSVPARDEAQDGLAKLVGNAEDVAGASNIPATHDTPKSVPDVQTTKPVELPKTEPPKMPCDDLVDQTDPGRQANGSNKGIENEEKGNFTSVASLLRGVVIQLPASSNLPKPKTQPIPQPPAPATTVTVPSVRQADTNMPDAPASRQPVLPTKPISTTTPTFTPTATTGSIPQTHNGTQGSSVDVKMKEAVASNPSQSQEVPQQFSGVSKRRDVIRIKGHDSRARRLVPSIWAMDFVAGCKALQGERPTCSFTFARYTPSTSSPITTPFPQWLTDVDMIDADHKAQSVAPITCSEQDREMKDTGDKSEPKAEPVATSKSLDQEMKDAEEPTKDAKKSAPAPIRSFNHQEMKDAREEKVLTDPSSINNDINENKVVEGPKAAAESPSTSATILAEIPKPAARKRPGRSSALPSKPAMSSKEITERNIREHLERQAKEEKTKLEPEAELAQEADTKRMDTLESDAQQQTKSQGPSEMTMEEASRTEVDLHTKLIELVRKNNDRYVNNPSPLNTLMRQNNSQDSNNPSRLRPFELNDDAFEDAITYLVQKYKTKEAVKKHLEDILKLDRLDVWVWAANAVLARRTAATIKPIESDIAPRLCISMEDRRRFVQDVFINSSRANYYVHKDGHLYQHLYMDHNQLADWTKELEIAAVNFAAAQPSFPDPKRKVYQKQTSVALRTVGSPVNIGSRVKEILAREKMEGEKMAVHMNKASKRRADVQQEGEDRARGAGRAILPIKKRSLA